MEEKTYEQRKQEILVPIFITHEDALKIREERLKEIDKEWDKHIKEFPDSRRTLVFRGRVERKVEEIMR